MTWMTSPQVLRVIDIARGIPDLRHHLLVTDVINQVEIETQITTENRGQDQGQGHPQEYIIGMFSNVSLTRSCLPLFSAHAGAI